LTSKPLPIISPGILKQLHNKQNAVIDEVRINIINLEDLIEAKKQQTALKIRMILKI